MVDVPPPLGPSLAVLGAALVAGLVTALAGLEHAGVLVVIVVSIPYVALQLVAFRRSGLRASDPDVLPNRYWLQPVALIPFFVVLLTAPAFAGLALAAGMLALDLERRRYWGPAPTSR